MTPLPRFPGAPQHLIERYLCGELTAEETREVEQRIASSPSLADHVAARRAQQHQFAAERPFALVRPRLDAGSKRRRLAVLLTAAAALALIALGLGLDGTPDSAVRVRGGLTVRLLVKRADAVFERAPGFALRPGDSLGVSVEDPQGGHLYLLALNDRGEISALHGFEPGTAPIPAGRFVIPASWKLNDSPERDAFYVVLSQGPRDQAELRAWLSSAARGDRFPSPVAPLKGARVSVLALDKDLP